MFKTVLSKIKKCLKVLSRTRRAETGSSEARCPILHAVGLYNIKSFARLLKGGRVLGQRPNSHSAECEILFIRKRRRGIKHSGGMFYGGEPSPGVLRTAVRRFLFRTHGAKNREFLCVGDS